MQKFVYEWRLNSQQAEMIGGHTLPANFLGINSICQTQLPTGAANDKAAHEKV